MKSLLFIPSNNKKMLEKIEVYQPDVFILDLEDSVPDEQKDSARQNISEKLDVISKEKIKSKIFIRLNSFDSGYYFEDVEKTIGHNVDGYMIPKFESSSMLLEFENYLAKLEEKGNIEINKIKLILQVESPKGIRVLGQLEEGFSKRVIAIAFGSEDYLASISNSKSVSEDVLDFARKILVFFGKSLDLLMIDTIFKNFTDMDGLKIEVKKMAENGFDGKLAIHPNQIEIINEAFLPSEEDLQKLNIILLNKDKIESEGAVNINGAMYDRAHLKWAEKIQKSL